MSDDKNSGPVPRLSPDDELEAMRHGIDRTRGQMSATLEALEERLSPSEWRDQAAIELTKVEAHVKDVVREELGEVRALLKDELRDAKQAASELIQTAKEAVKEDALAVKDAVKKDVQDALTHAKESARAATIGRVENLATQAGDMMNNTRDTIIDTVKQNPIPAALVGVGIVWLLMNRSSAARRRSESGNGNGSHSGNGHSHDSDGGGHRAMEAASQKMHQMASAVSGKVHDAAAAGSSALGRAVDSTSQFAHDATAATGNAARRVGGGISKIAANVPDQARRAGHAVETVYDDHPLAIGVTVLAVGALVGLSLPRTDREDRLLGATSEHLRETASDYAHKAVQQLGEMAETSKNAIADATNHHQS